MLLNQQSAIINQQFLDSSRVGHKPGSVYAAICLGGLLPSRSGGALRGRPGRPYPTSALHQAGLPKPAGCPAAGGLLPHRFTVTRGLPNRYLTPAAVIALALPPGWPVRAVLFCSAFHGLAASGSYPAPCPVVPGLSLGVISPRDRLAHSQHHSTRAERWAGHAA
jgi:hypothetical protein